MERLDKILANTGRWSRKEARLLIRAGRVQAAGRTARARRKNMIWTPPSWWTGSLSPESAWFT